MRCDAASANHSSAHGHKLYHSRTSCLIARLTVDDKYLLLRPRSLSTILLLVLLLLFSLASASRILASGKNAALKFRRVT